MELEYKPFTIKDMVSQINDTVFLPDIQRGYVWMDKNTQKIENLFDSIFRGYPFGSLLYWKRKRKDISDGDNEGLQLYKFIEEYKEDVQNVPIKSSQIDESKVDIVLDGQQRLTSLYLGIKGCIETKSTGKIETKYLHFNATAVHFEGETTIIDDDILFKFITLDEAVKRNDKNEGKWIRVSDIVSCKPETIYDKYGLYVKQVFSLWNKLCNSKCLSVCNIDEETDFDTALEIFIRINSGGTQLSYSDLLMSVITKNFENRQVRKDITDFVNDINESGYECFTRDSLLKTTLILSGLPHKFKIENFSKGNIKIIESNWEDIKKSISKACDVISGQGFRNIISSGYIISTVALYLYNHKNKLEDNDIPYLCRFISATQIRGYFSTSSDTTLNVIRDKMKGVKTFAEFYNNLTEVGVVGGLKKLGDADIDAFLKAKYGNRNIIYILQLLYPTLNYGDNKFHLDHIYPRSTGRKKGIKDIDSIVNLQLLRGDKNIKKSKTDPDKWIAEDIADNDRETYLSDNYIPYADLTWDKFDDFLKKREEKLRDTFDKILK